MGLGMGGWWGMITGLASGGVWVGSGVKEIFPSDVVGMNIKESV